MHARYSPAEILSPSLLVHCTILPSVMVEERAGMKTAVAQSGRAAPPAGAAAGASAAGAAAAGAAASPITTLAMSALKQNRSEPRNEGDWGRKQGDSVVRGMQQRRARTAQLPGGAERLRCAKCAAPLLGCSCR